VYTVRRTPQTLLVADDKAPDALAEWADDPEAQTAQRSDSGMVAATVVPPPDGLSTRSSPSIAATRS
jgi:hypothetical protein